MLRGESDAVRGLARRVIAESGVRDGEVSLVPVALRNAADAHGPGGSVRTHAHTRPGP